MEPERQHTYMNAAIGQRAAARILDTLFFWLALFIAGNWVFDLLGREGPRYADFVEIASYALFAAYEVVLTAVRGQTVGKMVARIRVVAEDGSTLPGWWRSLVRWGVPSVTYQVVVRLPLPVAFLGSLLVLGIYLYAIADPRKQGLHDKAARTLVVAVEHAS